MGDQLWITNDLIRFPILATVIQRHLAVLSLQLDHHDAIGRCETSSNDEVVWSLDVA